MAIFKKSTRTITEKGRFKGKSTGTQITVQKGRIVAGRFIPTERGKIIKQTGLFKPKSRSKRRRR